MPALQKRPFGHTNIESAEDRLDRLLANLIFASPFAPPRRCLSYPQAYHGTYGRL